MLEIEAAQPDVVLMDCQLPKLDGFETTRRLREISGMGEVPVIALSASVFPDDQRRCREAGMDDFVGKPVSRDALVRVLGKWL